MRYKLGELVPFIRVEFEGGVPGDLAYKPWEHGYLGMEVLPLWCVEGRNVPLRDNPDAPLTNFGFVFKRAGSNDMYFNQFPVASDLMQDYIADVVVYSADEIAHGAEKPKIWEDGLKYVAGLETGIKYFRRNGFNDKSMALAEFQIDVIRKIKEATGRNVVIEPAVVVSANGEVSFSDITFMASLGDKSK